MPSDTASSAGPQDALAVALYRYFGFERFRPGQREVIEAVLAGRSAVAILPTGGGKSLCYQLPALLSDGVTIVVSPLIALMKDQIDQLHARGILHSTAINSSLSRAEIEQRLRTLTEQKLKLLYVAPGRKSPRDNLAPGLYTSCGEPLTWAFILLPGAPPYLDSLSWLNTRTRSCYAPSIFSSNGSFLWSRQRSSCICGSPNAVRQPWHCTPERGKVSKQ